MWEWKVHIYFNMGGRKSKVHYLLCVEMFSVRSSHGSMKRINPLAVNTKDKLDSRKMTGANESQKGKCKPYKGRVTGSIMNPLPKQTSKNNIILLFLPGASKIKLKNVNKKRMATARRLIFFWNFSRHPLLI
jgi:hypothetical protein